jgi:type IV pilus assembly protein PilE
MNTRKKGFTLIELMIVLGIVAILVALALPSFQDALRKSRRSDALNSILHLQQAQERWRANHTTYGRLGNPSIPSVNLGPNPLISPDGHYSLTTTVNTTTNYTIVATVVTGDDQANDSCGNFTLTNTDGVIAKTNSAVNPDLCWRK